MAKSDRSGIRKKREQMAKSRFTLLGYYFILTDTKETEQNYMNGLRDSIPVELQRRLIIKVKKTNTEAYLLGKDVWKERVSKDNANGYLVAFVDGSYDKDLHRYSYGVVLIRPDGFEESICGHGSNKEYVDANNIIGEIFGVINAFKWV